MKKTSYSFPPRQVLLKDVGVVDVLFAGPLTWKLIKMIVHNGRTFTEEWMEAHGLHSTAKGFVYNEKQQRLVETVDFPLREFLLGMQGNKLYNLLDYPIVTYMEKKGK